MRSSLIGGVALILLGALAAWAEEKTETKKTLESGSLRIELRGTGQEGGGGIMLAPAGGNVVLSFGETAQPSQYWLGCQVAAVPEKQAKELKLPAGEGLLVEQVMPESPAAKGGIKPKDVLHKVGKRTIKKVSDLIEVIEKAKATDLVIEVIRDGKPEKVTVKPAKRPVPQAMNRAVTLSGASAWAWPNVALPDDMTVTLTKTGKKPAKVVVKQGDKTWEAGEGELAKLPAEARSYVARLLCAPPVPLQFAPPPGGRPLPPAWPGMLPRPPLPKGEAAGLKKRLDEMCKRLQKVEKSIEELKAEAKAEK